MRRHLHPHGQQGGMKEGERERERESACVQTFVISLM